MPRIIQFGTSRFLQAHVDLFVHEARAAGQDIGPVTVVKTTAGAERSGRVRAFRDPAGFPVRIQGYRDRQVIDETVQVTSVDSAYDAATEWPAIAEHFARDAAVVVSNVGDRGYEIDLTDRERPRSGPAASFPAKLLQLLLYRHEAGGAPLLILPCELLPANGTTLRGQIEELSRYWKTATAFADWLARRVVFADTLVDRIVAAAIEPLGAVAEPYALWAIRGAVPPLQHPAIVAASHIEPMERLKLHILNLGHTVLADIWQRGGRRDDETVRGLLADDQVRGGLLSLYADEVVPGFAAHGMGAEAERYITTTIDRFDNPFLAHRLSDIAQNHAAKIERRIANFITWAEVADSRIELPRLSLIAGSR